MTNCNQEILKALFKTRDLLSDEALCAIKSFVVATKSKNGGFNDRAGKPDLYYSLFAYTLCFAYDIEMDLEKEFKFLDSFRDVHELDLVHAVCFIRCYLLLSVMQQKQKFGFKPNIKDFDSFLGKTLMRGLIKKAKKDCQNYFELIETYRSKDGGYNHNEKQAARATVYASFLVWTLYQDLFEEEDNLYKITSQLQSLRCKDGSFANETSSSTGVTSATAAGLIMTLNHDTNQNGVIEYLMKSCTSRGGFKAAPDLPLADLLSTSTALLALYMVGENLQKLSSKSIDFINLHWDESGGFFGSIADMTCDVEYTYYALMGIGILI